MNSQVFLECKCAEEKKYRLVFDGGTSGQYMIDVCERCYQEDDKKFLLKEDKVTSLENISPREKKN